MTSPLLRNSQTLGGRSRRPTGPGKTKNRTSQVPEGSPPTARLQRSATTKATIGKDSPVQPLPYQPFQKIESQISETGWEGRGEKKMMIMRHLSVGPNDADMLPEQDDIDNDAYESLEEIFGGTTPNTTPAPAAPKYAAPPPPGVKPGEHDDHEYTPVNVTDGEVQVQEGRQEDVWAALPLKIGVSPPQKRRSPSVPLIGLHSSPTKQLHSPHLQPGLMPPEHHSPPGSPSGRKLTPPTPHNRGQASPEQPKLPPKKRREFSRLNSEPEISRWRGSPPQVPASVQVKPHVLLCVHLILCHIHC